MNMKLRNIPFSPPDMTEAEAKEVREAILSGWITTGPRTKKAGDFGVRAYGQDSLPELGDCCHGDGAAPAGCGPWR